MANLFCISEKSRKSRKMMMSLYLSRGIANWMAMVVEECLRSSINMGSYQTRREGDRVFLVQRCHNSYGSFVKLAENGTRIRKGIIVIREGLNRR